MATAALTQRVFRTLGESPIAERVADAQERVYGPLLDWAVHGPLHTDALGHSLHPPLTDLTLGCWLSASILDLIGGPGSPRSAGVLIGIGLLASAPTAVAGAADWAQLSGPERRIGAVHSLGTDVATVMFLGSLLARLRGRHCGGTRLALAGNLVATGAGLLGGHLALHRGTARRAP